MSAGKGRAWVITEEGYTGRVASERRKSKVVVVLDPRTKPEAVAFLVERLLAIDELGKREQLDEVVKGETALSVQHTLGKWGEIKAGHGPWLVARIVEDLEVVGEFPDEEFSWIEVPHLEVLAPPEGGPH